MIKKTLLVLATLALISIGGYLYFLSRQRPPVETRFVQELREESSGGVDILQPGEQVLLPNPRHVYQTFNNCGPATLSMILSFYGTHVSQKELGDAMRPYQNPQGDNDDKTIFAEEFVQWVERYGQNALYRPNGDIEILKTFTSNGIPVVVKTWLNLNDDIGHFRVVRGFDETRGVIVQDDSYHGPNKNIPYYDFLSMWQPFNYKYIIVFRADQEELVYEILGAEADEAVAWENAYKRGKKEAELDPDSVYPVFNQSMASYWLGKPEESVSFFEQVENQLPRRMLWYQIEPIKAYQELKDHRRVFEITEKVLGGGNRAFSELYLIRGEIYLEQGEIVSARREFELAHRYNTNLSAPKQYLDNLNP